MSKCLNTIVIFGLMLFIATTLYSQTRPVELSIQQGHAGEVVNVALSEDMRLMGTLDVNNKLVVWDLKTGSQLYFTYIDDKALGLSFLGHNNHVLIMCKNKTLRLDVGSSVLKPNDFISPPEKTSAYTPKGSYHLEGQKLVYYDTDNKKIKHKTPDYFDQPFTSLVYSSVHNKLYVACSDGLVYVYNEHLKLLNQFKGHLSDVNDLALSADQQYLYSVSSDRSAICWSLQGNTMVKRLAGKSYATYGLSVAPNQQLLRFGDEIGYLKQVDLLSGRLEVAASRQMVYPLKYTRQFSDTTVVIAGFENTIKKYEGNENVERYRVRKALHPKVLVHRFFADLLGMYRPHYSGVDAIDISPGGRYMIYGTNTNGGTLEFDFLRLVDLDSKKSSSRLFHLQSVVGDVCFMDDSTFVSTDHDKLILWRFYRDEIKHLYQKIISLPRPVVKQARLADGKLLLLGREGHISYYDHLAGTVINTDFNNTEDIFGLGTGRAVATTKDNTMYLLKEQDGAIISEAVFRGHQDRVTSVTMTPDNRLLFSSSLDASVKIWNIDSARLAMTVVPVGKNNALYVTPDNYYMTTGKSLLDFGFKVDDRFVFPEQFDALYNRPDIIMERLGYAPAPLVLAYKKAWEKRLEKLGIEESMLKKDFHLPELELLNAVAIPAESLSDTLLLKLKLKDSVYTLDRVNVWVNNVPVFGRKGLAVTKKNTDALYLDVPVKLVKGNNKVQMNVMNTAGAESFIESVEIKCMTGPQQANLYFVAMGVSEYKDPFYNLNYARKDGEDMESLMLENKNSFDQVHTLTLFDQQVTKEKLKEVRQFLMSSKENDQIIFFVSGHGLLNENYDFFFATHDTDFKDPAGRGIAYDMLDDLLDSLPARKKLLLLDACHSGEVDKEIAEPEGGVMIVQKDEETEEIKEYSFRGGSGGRLDDGLGLSSSFELMQELFANLNRGSGTVVLAAAAGNSFAREGPAWQNGVFTYCLRNALGDNKNKKMYADQNRDGKVTMVELQSYVAGEVSRLTNGKQKPVVRNENTAVEMIVR